MDDQEFEAALEEQVGRQAEPEPEPEPVEPERAAEPAYEQSYEQPVYEPPPTVTDEIEDLIYENPEGMAIWAAQTGHGPAYEQAMSEWYDQDARAASRFERAMDSEMEKQQTAAQQAHDRERGKRVVDGHKELSSKYSDFQEVISNVTQGDLKGLDPAVLQAAVERDPAGALELVYKWSASSGRKSRPAGNRPASRTAGTVMDKLKAEMLDPDPWDVRAGLERG